MHAHLADQPLCSVQPPGLQPHHGDPNRRGPCLTAQLISSSLHALLAPAAAAETMGHVIFFCLGGHQGRNPRVRWLPVWSCRKDEINKLCTSICHFGKAPAAFISGSVAGHQGDTCHLLLLQLHCRCVQIIL